MTPNHDRCPTCGSDRFPALVQCLAEHATENHPILGYVCPCDDPFHDTKIESSDHRCPECGGPDDLHRWDCSRLTTHSAPDTEHLDRETAFERAVIHGEADTEGERCGGNGVLSKPEETPDYCPGCEDCQPWRRARGAMPHDPNGPTPGQPDPVSDEERGEHECDPDRPCQPNDHLCKNYRPAAQRLQERCASCDEPIHPTQTWVTERLHRECWQKRASLADRLRQERDEARQESAERGVALRAAEAKLAEVEKERDELRTRAETAEASNARLIGRHYHDEQRAEAAEQRVAELEAGLREIAAELSYESGFEAEVAKRLAIARSLLPPRSDDDA